MSDNEILNAIILESQPVISSTFDYSGGVVVLPSADPVIIKASN